MSRKSIRGFFKQEYCGTREVTLKLTGDVSMLDGDIPSGIIELSWDDGTPEPPASATRREAEGVADHPWIGGPEMPRGILIQTDAHIPPGARVHLSWDDEVEVTTTGPERQTVKGKRHTERAILERRNGSIVAANPCASLPIPLSEGSEVEVSWEELAREPQLHTCKGLRGHVQSFKWDTDIDYVHDVQVLWDDARHKPIMSSMNCPWCGVKVN